MEAETKVCQNCKTQFMIEPDDFAFYEKIKVPPPTFCPECRLIRRLARRNERSFYKRICDKCKKSIISVFSPATGMTVYCSPCWWSDSWDGLEYGIDFNQNEPFFVQLDRLFHRVPIMNLYGLYTTLVNSDYTNMVSYLKNCYMVTYSDYCEEVVYGSFVNHTKDSVDNLMVENCELCYESINCNRCYRTFFSVDCESCSNVLFSKNCVGCNDCFGCVNLRNKSFCLFNEQFTKEEYKRRLAELYPSSSEKITSARNQVRELWQRFPQKYMHGWRNNDSTGDYLNDTKNAKSCFVGFDIEDSKFCSMITGKLTDAYDLNNFGLNSSLIYDSLQVGNQIARAKMGWWVITSCQDIEYGLFVISSQNLFGCVGLKKREYCILNKQYTKDEYETLRRQIIEHMNTMPYVDRRGSVYTYGEFFPIETSPFGYNETSAQEFFPLTKEQALAYGYLWREPVKKDYQVTIAANALPQTIEQVGDSIVNDIIGCEHDGICGEGCSTAFKITSQELRFYRRMNLPLPRLCPQCRHASRIEMRNPLKLWERRCQCAGAKSENGVYQNTVSHPHGADHCPNEFETSYAPDRPEIVYCETCYNAEVA